LEVKAMRNPFQYGSVVQGSAFCNRTKEIGELRRAIENAERLFVYSERRLGKTSLVRQALRGLPKKKVIGVYVDLWPTDSNASFATTTARALAQAHARTPKKILEASRFLFSRLVPSVTLDDAGKPRLILDFSSRRMPEQDLDEVLEAPATLAKATGRRVAVIFDECQRLLDYEDDLVERKLRSFIQHHDEVAYLFLGSRKHLIQKMFLDESRPLYRAAGHYPLRPIGDRGWIPFVRKRFRDGARTISDDDIRTICGLTQGHPFYTQHLCHVLWEICGMDGVVSGEMIDAALRILLERESFAYTTLWDALLKNQRRFLVGLALEPSGVQVFSAGFTGRYGLRSASNAQRAVEALLQKDIIDREEKSFIITDRFLRLWIRQVQGTR
jgi:uncharacterized protein